MKKHESNSRGLLSEKICSFHKPSTGNREPETFSTEYSYDNFDRIVRVSSPAGVYSYTYDSKGRIASLTMSSPSASFVVSNSYDSAGRLFSKTFNAGGNKTQLAVYEYDKLDRIVKSEVNGNHWQYSYDELGQLISAKSAELGNYEYGYDKIGNRLKDKIQLASREFSYNNLNQIANQGFEYDAYGNLVKTPDAKYKYDLSNRLIEVEKADVKVKYSYDPLGQRIKSEEVTTKGTKNTKFLMSGMVEQARKSSSGLQPEKIQYHTLGLDLAGSLTATGCVGGVLASTSDSESFNYLYDGNGNVVAYMDAEGRHIAKLAYSPFGELLSSTDNRSQNTDHLPPFTFSTKAVDASGLSYYGFRFYSAEMGRWLSRDEIEERGGDNFYAFCNNEPNSNFDVKGLVAPAVALAGCVVKCNIEQTIISSYGNMFDIAYMWGDVKRYCIENEKLPSISDIFRGISVPNDSIVKMTKCISDCLVPFGLSGVIDISTKLDSVVNGGTFTCNHSTQSVVLAETKFKMSTTVTLKIGEKEYKKEIPFKEKKLKGSSSATYASCCCGK